jgi:hypothetical protein
VFGDDINGESFEERMRSIARELGRSVERAVDNLDVEQFANSIGADPDVAREWAEGAGTWLRTHAESLGAEVAGAAAARRAAATDDALRRAAPHPLDLPTDEQGVALAALDSGRWTVEPGTDALAAKREGPQPGDAFGVVRELRVRDWITGDGELTLVGRHALSRWLDAGDPR